MQINIESVNLFFKNTMQRKCPNEISLFTTIVCKILHFSYSMLSDMQIQFNSIQFNFIC